MTSGAAWLAPSVFGTALFSTNVITVSPSAIALTTMPATHSIVWALPW